MSIKDDLKKWVINDLHLEDVTPEGIVDDEPLFGDGGLGLDSLDAVELVVLIQKRFGVVIKDMEEAKEAFVSVNSLSEFILGRQAGTA
ncbi:MAG: phosphopantetheine-binding protein [Deltaproteobacteria bacterium]|nr:phosphopantetheine-binding protein [Deltaproteobacteria bacterium]